MTTFRTATGQTGPDAYVYEAAQIRNLQRELDARTRRLAEAMVAELPADARVLVSIASQRYPDAVTEADRGALVRMLPLIGGAAANADWLLEYARGLGDPTYVVRDSGSEV
jgi:hypothetical protein